MVKMQIEHAHGYLLDSDGRVIQRFGNWDTGERDVHPATNSIEYVDGPNAHKRKIDEEYKPTLSE